MKLAVEEKKAEGKKAILNSQDGSSALEVHAIEAFDLGIKCTTNAILSV